MSNNGLILCGKYYIPKEMIVEILRHCTDKKTLLNCHRVCKLWNMLMKNYVWREKTKANIGTNKLPTSENLDWRDCYSICATNLFDKNLLNQWSDLNKWKIQSDSLWNIERPPIGVSSLPNIQYCFATITNRNCVKRLRIDLIKEGFSKNILDNLQPPIEISDWYSCKLNWPSSYMFSVELENKYGQVVDKFFFSNILENERQNVWHNFKHKFKNYGKGVRRICFAHGGKNINSNAFPEGYHGIKIANTCVKVNYPTYKRLDPPKMTKKTNELDYQREYYFYL